MLIVYSTYCLDAQMTVNIELLHGLPGYVQDIHCQETFNFDYATNLA